MHLQLRDQQLKTISYIHRLLYKNFRITAYQKSTIDTQRNININTTLKRVIKPQEESIREEGKKKEQQQQKNKYKAINKMAIRTYISIITLSVDGLNTSTKRH